MVTRNSRSNRLPPFEGARPLPARGRLLRAIAPRAIALLCLGASGACALPRAGLEPPAVARASRQPASQAANVEETGELREPLLPETEPRPPRPDDVGTAHPVWVREAAPDGRWVALCQARRDDDGDGRVSVRVGSRGELSGDRLQSYLVTGSGPGEPIDRFVASGPRGRHLAFVRDERLVLRDVTSARDVDLSARGARLETDDASFAPHRGVRFGPLGRHVVYPKRAGHRDRVVVRRLDDGAEVELDPGEGLLWRAELDATGQWVVMRVVNADTNDNGRWEWPVVRQRRPRGDCAGPLPRYRAWPLPGDDPVTRIAPVGGGAVREVRGFLSGFGRSGWLRRSPDRALFYETPDGTRELVSASRCNARILHSDPDRGLLVVACEGPEEYLRELQLVGVGTQVDLGLEILAFEQDSVAPAARLVGLYAGIETTLLDFETRETLSLESRDRVLGTSGSSVLLERGDRLLLWDVAGHHPAPVGRLVPLSPKLRTAGVVFARPWVVDVGQGRVLGRSDRAALALTTRGELLVPRRDGDAHRLPEGPLSWLRPEPRD